jgi:small subunit ribosomal protein S16
LVRIRLRRTGAKGQPSYRVVVADSRSPRDGRFIEIIGHYNPRVEPSEIVINKEKALAWIAQGARPSESVASLLRRSGVTGEAPVVDEAAAPVAVTHAKRRKKAAVATA